MGGKLLSPVPFPKMKTLRLKILAFLGLNAPDSYSTYFLPVFTLLLHLAVANQLGYDSNELYFLDCSKHLDLGFYDLTPLTPLLIRIFTEIFGVSLFSLRIFPALAHGLSVYLSAKIVSELGGNRFARIVASICVLIAPAYLRIGSVFVIPSAEVLIWTLTNFLILRAIKTEKGSLWLWVGLVTGIGYLNKPTILLLVIGLFFGILLTPTRKILAEKWIWLGGLIAALIALPNLYWQSTHHWATVDFILSVKNSSHIRGISLIEFFLGQLLYLNPINAIIWIAGIYFFSFDSLGKQFRVFGWIYLISVVLLLSQGTKLYYLLPIYPVLLAAGSVEIESRLRIRRKRHLQMPFLILITLFGLFTMPAGLPILPVDVFDRFVDHVTLGAINQEQAPELFEMFRDMEGSERNEMLTEISRLFQTFSPEEKNETAILAGYYTQAAAINFFGPKLGLPQAISGSVGYFFWGPNNQSGEITIAVGFDPLFLKKHFRTVVQDPKAAYLAVCRNPIMPLKDIWYLFRSLPYD